MADRPELYDGKAEKEEARKDKIWQVKMGYADESIFEKSLQMCHGGCGEYLTKEEEEILEIDLCFSTFKKCSIHFSVAFNLSFNLYLLLLIYFSFLC